MTDQQARNTSAIPEQYRSKTHATRLCYAWAWDGTRDFLQPGTDTLTTSGGCYATRWWAGFRRATY